MDLVAADHRVFSYFLALGDGFTLSLRYERAAIAAGGWWRC
jgi:hypothetical protein